MALRGLARVGGLTVIATVAAAFAYIFRQRNVQGVQAPQAPEAQEPDDSALTDVITNLRSRNQDLVARMQELQAEQERQVEANHRLRQELQEVTAENVRLTGRIAGIEAGLVRTRAELAEREVELRKARKKGWFSSK